MALVKIHQVKVQNILGVEVRFTNSWLKHIEGTTHNYKPESGVVSQGGYLFKYNHEHSIPPVLVVSPVSGDKYIVPTWQKVHPKTTLQDINWIKPVRIEIPVEKENFQFESSSDPGYFYKVTKQGDKISCNCSGFWRCLDKSKGCKHVQEVRKQIKEYENIKRNYD